MNKLRVAVGLLALLCAVAASSASAYAAFKADSPTAFEDEESATSLTIKGSKGSIVVACKTVAGGGEVMETRGKTGNAAKEDEPASVPVKESAQIGFMVAFEGCTTELEGKKANVVVSAGKCQIEFFQAKEETTVSLRAAKKETPCELKIEIENRCEAKISAKASKENEELKSANVKALKEEGEYEFEKGSIVKGMTTTEKANEECKIGKIEASQLELQRAVVARPTITTSPVELDFGEVKKLQNLTKAIKVKNRQAVKYEVPSVAGDEGAFSIVKDACENTARVAGAECVIEVKFEPKVVKNFAGTLKIPFKYNAFPLNLLPFTYKKSVNLQGKGIA